MRFVVDLHMLLVVMVLKVTSSIGSEGPGDGRKVEQRFLERSKLYKRPRFIER